jgi:hypothetical protein
MHFKLIQRVGLGSPSSLIPHGYSNERRLAGDVTPVRATGTCNR